MHTVYIMKQHSCELCHTIFNRKTDLSRHSNKLRKCNTGTDFECDFCSRSFSTNSNLSRHLTTCKVKRNQDDIKRDAQITNCRLEELEAKCKMLLEEKLTATATASATINGNSNTQHSHNPINSLNNTTNITINNYGSEDLSHINLKRITFVFSKSFSSVVECVKLKHFHPLAPQNKNVCIKDIKSKYAYVFCDGNWDVIGRKKLIDNMYIDICEYIEEKLNEFNDELDGHIKLHINRFLDNKDDSEYADNIKIDLEALIFNKNKMDVA